MNAVDRCLKDHDVSEFLIEIVEQMLENYNIKFYFIRNIFFYHSYNEDCVFNELNWLKFYDFNFVIGENYTYCKDEIISLVQSHPQSFAFKNDKSFNEISKILKDEINLIKVKIDKFKVIDNIVNSKIYSLKVNYF